MPSFDIVSRTELPEVDNAIQGAMREIGTRYDFKGSKCTIERAGDIITMRADDVTDGGDAEKVTQNAPEGAHGFFVVPKVVE